MVETIKIDDIEYVRADSVSQEDITGDLKIVLLQRGWVFVGYLERNGSQCKLKKASNIRRWGTEHGLGQIAKDGPTDETRLDKCHGVVEFDYLTTVATIDCEEKPWKRYL